MEPGRGSTRHDPERDLETTRPSTHHLPDSPDAADLPHRGTAVALRRPAGGPGHRMARQSAGRDRRTHVGLVSGGLEAVASPRTWTAPRAGAPRRLYRRIAAVLASRCGLVVVDDTNIATLAVRRADRYPKSWDRRIRRNARPARRWFRCRRIGDGAAWPRGMPFDAHLGEPGTEPRQRISPSWWGPAQHPSARCSCSARFGPQRRRAVQPPRSPRAVCPGLRGRAGGRFAIPAPGLGLFGTRVGELPAPTAAARDASPQAPRLDLETGIVGWVFDAVGIARAAASAVMRKVLPAKTEATERQ